VYIENRDKIIIKEDEVILKDSKIINLIEYDKNKFIALNHTNFGLYIISR
jgi:hypothetical protein